jgi:hypothetical protein
MLNFAIGYRIRLAVAVSLLVLASAGRVETFATAKPDSGFSNR